MCIRDSQRRIRIQELCESGGGRPGLPVPNKPTVSVDVKHHSTKLRDEREKKKLGPVWSDSPTLAKDETDLHG